VFTLLSAPHGRDTLSGILSTWVYFHAFRRPHADMARFQIQPPRPWRIDRAGSHHGVIEDAERARCWGKRQEPKGGPAAAYSSARTLMLGLNPPVCSWTMTVPAALCGAGSPSCGEPGARH
jgi:hypothetical protein